MRSSSTRTRTESGKNKWKSLGLKEGASKAKINAAMREAVNDFEKELTEILTRSQNPDADMPVFEYMVKWLGSVQPSLQINTYRSYHNMIYGRIKRYFSPKSITIASLQPESDRRILSVHLRRGHGCQHGHTLSRGHAAARSSRHTRKKFSPPIPLTAWNAQRKTNSSVGIFRKKNC